MKIIVSADWHINLRKKKIPHDWQVNRYKQLFSKIYELEKEADIHILAGDIFDMKPDNEEVCLLLDFLNNVSIPTLIIPGNHEATKKGKSFLENFTKYNAVKNKLAKIYTENSEWHYRGQTFQFFPYGEMQLDNLPVPIENSILVTHIRGEVLPHIHPEYNFDKLKPWKLVFLGDLHFAHKYKDYPIYYPGSPLNVVFDRDDSKKYGLYMVDFFTIDKYKIDFIDLDLPKLIRKTIKAGEAMIPHNKHHVIYEIVGSRDELSKIEANDLLDKKLAHRPDEESTLKFDDSQTLAEELELYLKHIKIENIKGIMKEFSSLNIA